MSKPDKTLEPFNWWHSGRLWYCFLERYGKKPVSGAGETKPQAVNDARRELVRKYGPQTFSPQKDSGR